MTDPAVLGAISALSKKMDNLGGAKELNLPVTYTMTTYEEGVVTPQYGTSSSSFVGAVNGAASVAIGNEIYYLGGDENNAIFSTFWKYNVVTNEVTLLNPYPGPVTEAKMAVFNGKIAAIGGYSDASRSSVRTEVYVYDPALNTWTTHTPLTYSTVPSNVIASGNRIWVIFGDAGSATDYIHYRDFSAVGNAWSTINATNGTGGASAQVGSNIFIFTGYTTNTYSINAASGSSLTSLAAMPRQMYRARAVVVGTNIYLIGSEYSSGYYQLVDMYDTIANTWTSKASLPNNIFSGVVGTNGTTKIWAVRDNGVTFEYDVATNVWTTKNSAATKVRGYRYTYLYGNNLIVSGWGHASILSFNTSSNVWATPYSSYMINDATSAYVAVGTKVYAFGGYYISTSGNNLSMAYDTETKKWTMLANMPRVRYRACAVHKNGKIYVFGGTNGSSLAFTDVYDVATDTWTTKANMPAASTATQGYAAPDGYIYVSTDSPGMYRYDPVGDTWTTRASNPSGRYNSVTVGVGDKIYVFNGSSGYDIYDITNNTWSAVAGTGSLSSSYYTRLFTYNGKIYCVYQYSMYYLDETKQAWTFVTRVDQGNQALYAISAAAMNVGDNVYFIGGAGTRPLVRYNIATNKWNSITMPNTSNIIGGAITSDGTNIYVVGGSNTTNYNSGYSTIYKWSPETNYWDVWSMSKNRYGAAAAVWGNRLFVFGGRNTSGANLTDVDEYSTSSGTATAKTAMSSASSSIFAATCGDYIYVMRDSTLWQYNPASDSWVSLFSVSNWSGGGLVSDGYYVYILGGYSTDALRLFRYDPLTGVQTALPNMPKAHTSGQFVAARGKILAIGGQESVSQYVDVYDTETKTWTTSNILPVNERRVAGGAAYADNKVYVVGGYTNSSSLYGTPRPETFAINYLVVDPLPITESGVYHSLTNGITLTNPESGRTGDSVAVGVSQNLYPVGRSVELAAQANMKVLRT